MLSNSLSVSQPSEILLLRNFILNLYLIFNWITWCLLSGLLSSLYILEISFLFGVGEDCVDYPSVCCEYVLLPLVNKEVDLANSQAE